MLLPETTALVDVQLCEARGVLCEFVGEVCPLVSKNLPCTIDSGTYLYHISV